MKKYLTFLAGFVCAALLISYCAYNGAFSQKVNAYASETFYVQSTSKEAVTSFEVMPKRTSIDVPFISQTEKYPNGCEAVSSVMVLRYFGFDISVDCFIDELLPMGCRPQVNGIGPDPERVYCGDPRSPHGWGCYSSVIAGIFESLLNETEYTYIHSYTDSLDELCVKYIDNGIPVIVWATVDMVDSRDMYAHWKTEEGKDIYYNRKLHCLVLTGYDSENYYFNDPMVGKNISYSKKESKLAYEILGSQSIALVKK